jgi:hypothetical protein
MKAYFLDLRQKVVDVYSCGDISQRKLVKNATIGGISPLRLSFTGSLKVIRRAIPQF